MKSLINIITEHVEIIAQISARIRVNYKFYLDNSYHANERKTRPDLIEKGYDQTPVTNKELVDFFEYFRNDIAENISIHNIILDKTFIIRSISKKLACAVALDIDRNEDFILKIVTVFRESTTLRLTPYPGQLVITKD
jgi:hypothetical protein